MKNKEVFGYYNGKITKYIIQSEGIYKYFIVSEDGVNAYCINKQEISNKADSGAKFFESKRLVKNSLELAKNRLKAEIRKIENCCING